MICRSTLVLAAALLSAPAYASSVSVRVVDTQGRPVPDAVITVHPAAGTPGGPIRFPWGTTMLQKDIAFNPHTLIVPVGATVAFPNADKVRHHVYSFSKPARFQLKLFGKDETRSYTFQSTGAVALGCNIHDTMTGFIKVVDTPFANKTGDTGEARIAGVMAGKATLTVWHPRMRAKFNESSFALVVPATGDTAQQIRLVLR